MLELQPPQGLMDKGARVAGWVDRRLGPERCAAGLVQEVVLTGDDVDLGLLPIQRCWPSATRRRSSPSGRSRADLRTGIRNSVYRMQIVDRNTTYMHWQIHKDGRADWLATDGRIPVSVALGLDPVTAYSASAPLPKHIGELMLAGFFRGASVEMVKCVTNDLEVPAHAEIALEGYIEKDELGLEGPFGDHTGYYTRPSRSPSSTSPQ